VQSFWKQAAPVDMYTGHIGPAEYLVHIIKFSFNGRTQYQGSLIVPKASSSVMFIVAAPASVADQERDSYVERIVLDVQMSMRRPGGGFAIHFLSNL
jgi:hypothetical protein